MSFPRLSTGFDSSAALDEIQHAHGYVPPTYDNLPFRETGLSGGSRRNPYQLHEKKSITSFIVKYKDLSRSTDVSGTKKTPKTQQPERARPRYTRKKKKSQTQLII